MAAEETSGLPVEPMTAISTEDATGLARRAAGAAGLKWPQDPSAVHGVAGMTLSVTPHAGAETVVWATLDKQDGILAVFAGARLLAVADKSLGSIERVQPIDLPGLPYAALLVEDKVDQMAGAFYREERYRLYVWDGRGLRQVFSGIKNREELIHSRWQSARAGEFWRLHRTTGELKMKGGLFTLALTREQLEALGAPGSPVPPPAKFRVVERSTSEEQYRWNERLHRFDRVEPAAQG